jgi:polyisoprenoid-binding protein YceI
MRIALCTALATGCSSVPEARVAETVPSALAAGSDVERYELQAEHMAVEADVSAGKSYTLVFPKARGTMSVSPSRLESSTVSLQFDMSSATSTPQLAADVAKNRFLHADRYPSASLESRSMKRGAEGLELWLDFTIHGTKRTLVMPAKVELSTCRAKLACEFAFDRQTYGIIDTGSLDSLVSDTVVVRATIDVARKSAPASCAAKPTGG